MRTNRSTARGLATAFLSGEWTRETMAARAHAILGGRRKLKSVDGLVSRILAHFGEDRLPPLVARLTDFIVADSGFRRYLAHGRNGGARRLAMDEIVGPEMTPLRVITDEWTLPAIVTTTGLADWLGLSRGELSWFADVQRRERHRRAEALRHYRYRWIEKRSGGRRLLEIPKPRLKGIQRAILHDILDRVVPHEAAHAFRYQRSIASFAAPHAGQKIVLRIDLRDFFPCVTYRRILSLFRAVGYPEAVARLIAGLCTNSVPDDVIRQHSWKNTPGRSLSMNRRTFHKALRLPQRWQTSRLGGLTAD